MASPARFECATFRLGGERPILLSYGEIDSYSFYDLPIAIEKQSGADTISIIIDAGAFVNIKNHILVQLKIATLNVHPSKESNQAITGS